MIKISFAGVGGRAREAICRRDYQSGDVVRVPGAKWAAWSHPRGGMGAWAIYVGKTSGKYRVRPLDASSVSQAPVEVNTIEHLDDVEMKLALAHYRAERGNG